MIYDEGHGVGPGANFNLIQLNICFMLCLHELMIMGVVFSQDPISFLQESVDGHKRGKTYTLAVTKHTHTHTHTHTQSPGVDVALALFASVSLA